MSAKCHLLSKPFLKHITSLTGPSVSSCDPFALVLVSTAAGRPRRSCWTSWRRGGGAPTSASPCAPSALALTETPPAAPPPSSTRRCWSRSTCATWHRRWGGRADGRSQVCCTSACSQPLRVHRPSSDRRGVGSVGG